MSLRTATLPTYTTRPTTVASPVRPEPRPIAVQSLIKPVVALGRGVIAFPLTWS